MRTNHHNHKVCPWWKAYTFDNLFRRLIHKPEKMFAGLVKEGMTVVDIGAGMGFFSIAMARMVGDSGKVISVDIQSKMIKTLEKRARKRGVADKIQTILCKPDDICVKEKADFILAFYVVHEVPDIRHLFQQVIACMKPETRFLVVEPSMHVSSNEFEQTLKLAIDSGLILLNRPKILLSRSALFGLV